MKQCKVPGCEKPKHAHSFCGAHYMIHRRGMDPYTYKPRKQYKTPEEKLLNRSKRVGDCIEWTGATRGKDGHGIFEFTLDGKRTRIYAHRYVYEQSFGKLEKEEFVDHKCRNPKCINIDHLRVANKSQNASNLRGANSASITGIRNISYDEKRGKYFVQVTKNYKNHYGGSYENLEEAKIAAQRLRAELFGEYAGLG